MVNKGYRTIKEATPLQYIKGVGPKRAEVLASMGIHTPADLLLYFPRAYVDRNASASIKQLSNNLRSDNLFSESSSAGDILMHAEVTVVGEVDSLKEHRFGRGRSMLKVRIADGSGGFAGIVFWNMVDYFKKAYKIGQTLVISGKPETDKYGFVVFNHPEIERIDPEDMELYKSGSILPKYKSNEAMKSTGMNMRLMRKIIGTIIDNEIDNLKETLPKSILEKFRLPGIKQAVRNLHFPESKEKLEVSRFRIKFEELFYYELFLALKMSGTKNTEKGILMDPKSPMARTLYESLPFQLTGDQKKVLREVASDIQSGLPMNRLLQGDVGSGKTIVAILAMLMAIENGTQVALMAPTELLAEQHYHTLNKFLESFDLNVVQLVGGQRKKIRREILEKVVSGEANIIVGTHAMFESDIVYNKLGMVIIDEQHRFGVAQRAELKKLASASFEDDRIIPHMLVMTATPIPRTLSMTVYGDLDVSVIREMPKNRLPIRTKITFESNLPEVYEFIRGEIKKGRQVFIVYPLVEKSDKLELKAATEHHEMLSREVFPDLKCGLLHGQMFWYEKDETMKAFLDREYDIMVATTVIEVGIDIPNATVMLIENAERFGLSQLHQLRGRVGRGPDQSYCILVTKDHFQYQLKNKSKNEDERLASVVRLKTMAETTDGFKISEVDLRLRGPGDMLGTRQSGLPDFKYADIVNDGEIITLARKEAFSIIDSDPRLSKDDHSLMKSEFINRYGDDRNFFDIA